MFRNFHMARPDADDDQEKPLDPHVESVRRKLVRFMAVNLGILFFALMVVIVALVYKSRNGGPPPPASVGDIPAPAGEALGGDIVLPVGSRVVSQSLSANRIALDVELADGSRTIFVYDIAERRLVARLAVRTQ